MHGLVNRSIEGFLRDTYGDALWQRVAGQAGVDPRGFHSVQNYSDASTQKLIAAACEALSKPSADLLEDLGAWIVRLELVRRLLRFSGRDFIDFLMSLDELPGRAQMVLPELRLPRLKATGEGPGQVCVQLTHGTLAWRDMLAGLIRGMADDYGALGLILTDGMQIRVHVSDTSFTEGRDFHLSAGPEMDAAR